MGELVKNADFIGLSKAFGTKEFGEVLEQAYKDGGRQNEFKTKTSFAPSSIYGSGTCPRYWYYAFHGATFEFGDTPATSIANMNSGTDAGKRLAGLFEKAGILVAAEVEVKHEDPPIGGFIDVIVNWKDEEVIGEIKTTKTESWNFRRNNMTVPGYQLIQLLIYMKVKNKDKGFFLIENKNTHELVVIPIKMTPQYEELVEQVFTWMRRVKANSDVNKLPKRPFTPKSMQCKSCPVWSTCWEGYVRQTAKRQGSDPNPGVVELPPLEIPK